MVPLVATTEKVTLSLIGTLWLKGWTVMTGSGPAPKQGHGQKQAEQEQAEWLLLAAGSSM